MTAAAVSAALLLAGALAAYGCFLRGSLGALPGVARWVGDARGRRFAWWCGKALALFGAVAIVELALLGRVSALVEFPVEFAIARAAVTGWIGDGRDLPVGWMMLALIGGGVVGGVIDRLRGRGRPWMLGDIARLLPRHRGEIAWGVALALVAGTTEELFFRLLVPLLVAIATGEAAIGFAVALVLFAGAHRYQGWVGVAATALVGVLLTLLYLMTGSLAVAMSVHVVIDLNGLMLRPVMAGVWRVSSSAATPS